MIGILEDEAINQEGILHSDWNFRRRGYTPEGILHSNWNSRERGYHIEGVAWD